MEPKCVASSDQKIDRGRIALQLASGREVGIEQIHIELTTLGVLEGRFEVIRECVLASLPDRVRAIFPGKEAFSGHFDPPANELPSYVISVSLISLEPIGNGDFSSLVHSWLADNLTGNLIDQIQNRVRSIPWESVATDGLF
jgi:hypothetical protein